MWSDDISFCPDGKCKRKTCPRNQMNIRDRSVPHSYFVDLPPDCPKKDKTCINCRWYDPSEEYCVQREIYCRKTHGKGCEDYCDDKRKKAK